MMYNGTSLENRSHPGQEAVTCFFYDLLRLLPGPKKGIGKKQQTKPGAGTFAQVRSLPTVSLLRHQEEQKCSAGDMLRQYA
ncbi:MAG: hypothetical protein SVT52_00315 [Planctomycetota bacterium]|nr:hypothetical protein [Planctomycetota bacterium]